MQNVRITKTVGLVGYVVKPYTV